MDDNIAVIHQNPVSRAVALYLARFKTSLKQLFLHVVRHGLNLADIGATGDNKIVSQNGNALDVDNLYVLTLLIFKSLYGQLYHIF